MNLRTMLVMSTLCFCLNAKLTSQQMEAYANQRYALSKKRQYSGYRKMIYNGLLKLETKLLLDLDVNWKNNEKQTDSFTDQQNQQSDKLPKEFQTLLTNVKADQKELNKIWISNKETQKLVKFRSMFNHIGNGIKDTMEENLDYFDYVQHLEKLLGFLFVSKFDQNKNLIYRANFEDNQNFQNRILKVAEDTEPEFTGLLRDLWIEIITVEKVVNSESVAFEKATQRVRKMLIYEHQHNSLQTMNQFNEKPTDKYKDMKLYGDNEWFNEYKLYFKDREAINHKDFKNALPRLFGYAYLMDQADADNRVRARYSYAQKLADILMGYQVLTIYAYDGEEKDKYNMTMHLKLSDKTNYTYDYLDKPIQRAQWMEEYEDYQEEQVDNRNILLI